MVLLFKQIEVKAEYASPYSLPLIIPNYFDVFS